MTDDTTKAPERIVTRHYRNSVITARPANEGFAHGPGNEFCECEYVRADLSRPAPVTVKPLEWGEQRQWCGQPAWYADTEQGVYCIVDHSKFGNDFSIDGPGIEEGGFKSKAQAETRINKLYKSNILSALTPAPVTPAQAARVLLGASEDELTSLIIEAIAVTDGDSEAVLKLYKGELRALADQERE